jgi:hypothetical protein
MPSSGSLATGPGVLTSTIGATTLLPSAVSGLPRALTGETR